MYLSQLEIFGFKSFPEKTTLQFSGDVTAVVGPNGCGKTNILDSIRWVLGEQRSSALRSSKMEEVIFNGTAQMKPLGLAEVNLTIKNNRGILPLEYDEVVITRRLYRSGESEYFLNKSQCRLKDIMELFYDTGMGPHAYSVIQQGMIDAILSDRAEDRRSLFEEAAGVTKYKHRKKEALAKLEATKSDLLRLGDIIVEIEKQVNQLRRQAARARQYNRQKDELKQIELMLAAALFHESNSKFQNLEIKRNQLQAEIAALNADYERREMNLQEARLKMTELERQAGEHRQRQSDFSAKAAEIESEIKLNKHKVETGTNDIANGKADILALNGRIQTLRQGIEENSVRLKSFEQGQQSLHAANEELESGLAEKAGKLGPCETSVNEIRSRNSGLGEKISALKAEESSLAEMKRKIESKLEEAQRDAQAIDKTRIEGQSGLGFLEQKYIQQEKEADNIKNLIREQFGKITELEKRLNLKREMLAKEKAELSGLEARWELLGQLIETGEGYSSGAKCLMEWTERPEGMMQPLAEVLGVPDRYRVAVAVALGSLSEIIPVRGYSDADAAIAHLKSVDGGRASFLVMEKAITIAADSKKSLKANGFIGFLDQLTKYPDDYLQVVSLLLGRVALFESKETALNAGPDWDYFTRVDLDGYVIMPQAVISGGKATTGVLGRRQDLNAVQDLIKDVSQIIRHIEEEFNSELLTLQKTRDEYANLEKSSGRIEEERKKIEAELGQVKFDFKERETKYASTLEQAENLVSEIAYFEAKLERLRIESAEFEIEQRKGAEELNELSSRLFELRGAVSQLESRLTQARIKMIEQDSQISRLKSDIEHGRELCDEAEKMIASHQSKIESAESNIKEATANNEELETRLYDIFAQRREVQSKLHEIEDSLTEFMADVGKIEEELSHCRKEKDRWTSSNHALDLEFLELETGRKSIRERMRMEFNISSLEPAPLPGEISEDVLRKNAEEIRGRLQKMDPVNLMAAEDYEREKDRLDFLIRQRDDLLEAEASLKEAISKINTTAEERFRETFAKIQENFETVFLTLFEGGEARLELEEESNPLESSIRILARPGGKRLLSVAQLSGGERALTAISLLFGIYLVKPSPFCILDEVDAPLDDANLLRFLKIIKRFSESTQFIIITHNKMTMEASDILYGVTMETPGVSKVVSVKFAGNGNGNGDGDRAKDAVQ